MVGRRPPPARIWLFGCSWTGILFFALALARPGHLWSLGLRPWASKRAGIRRRMRRLIDACARARMLGPAVQCGASRVVFISAGRTMGLPWLCSMWKFKNEGMARIPCRLVSLLRLLVVSHSPSTCSFFSPASLFFDSLFLFRLGHLW